MEDARATYLVDNWDLWPDPTCFMQEMLPRFRRVGTLGLEDYIT